MTFPRLFGLGFVGFLAVFVLFISVDAAKADPATECAPAFEVDMCVALASRLDDLDARLEANEDAQKERQDLGWWGQWATVGVLFALLVAPMMQRAFRWWRE